MKKYNFLVVMLLSMFVGFTACSDDNDDPQPNTLTVTPAKLEFEAKGGVEMQIKVETSAPAYTYVVKGDWFEIKKYDDTKYIGVIAKENTSLEALEGKITFSAENAVDQVVTLLQSAAAPAELSLSEAEITVSKTAVEKKDITIETNQANVTIKDLESLPEWCTPTLSDDNKTLSISMTLNETGKTRSTSIFVVAGVEGNSIEKEIKVVQSAYDVLHLNATGYRIKLNGMTGITATVQDSWCLATIDGDVLAVSAGDNMGGSVRKTEIELSDGSTLWVEQSAETYKTGDVFKFNDQPVGVVVSNDEDGLLILSLEEKEKVQWSIEEPLGLNAHQKNAYEAVKKIDGWKEKYPAFAYCAELDEKTGMEGWCLGEYFNNNTQTNANTPYGKLYANYETVREALKTIEGAALFDEPDSFGKGRHWTSSTNAEFEEWDGASVYVHSIYETRMSFTSTNADYGAEYCARCFWKFVKE